MPWIIYPPNGHHRTYPWQKSSGPLDTSRSNAGYCLSSESSSDCSWNIRVRVWCSLNLYKASSVADAVVGCRTALICGAGVLKFLCCGDAFEFSICGGSFLWVEFGCELSPEIFYLTNDMFSAFWFGRSRGLFSGFPMSWTGMLL